MFPFLQFNLRNYNLKLPSGIILVSSTVIFFDDALWKQLGPILGQIL